MITQPDDYIIFPGTWFAASCDDGKYTVNVTNARVGAYSRLYTRQLFQMHNQDLKNLGAIIMPFMVPAPGELHSMENKGQGGASGSFQRSMWTLETTWKMAQ